MYYPAKVCKSLLIGALVPVAVKINFITENQDETRDITI